MATTAKRSGKTKTARRKTAKKAVAKKTATAPRRSPAKAKPRAAAPKQRRQAAKKKTAARASTGSASNTSAAKKSKLAAGTKTRSRRKPVAAKKAPRRMSPQARKNLVAKGLRELLEEKNRRAAQTPPWQLIVHHDRPAPMSPPQVPDAGEAPPLGESGPGATGRGSRDRGGN